MAYNVIYTATFHDNVKDDEIAIYIKQKDFLGSPTNLILDANPLIITYTNKEFNNQIFGCGCKINIINNSQDFFKFDSLFSTPQKSNYVEIIKTSNNLDSSIILFEGYVLPELYATTLEKNIKLTIPAVDYLGQLERYKPALLVDTSTYRAPEFVNTYVLFNEVVQDIRSNEKNIIVTNTSLEHRNFVRGTSSNRTDTITFSGGGVGDEAFIICNSVGQYYSFAFTEQISNQRFVNDWDVSYGAADVSMRVLGNTIEFKHLRGGVDFISDTSVTINLGAGNLSAVIGKRTVDPTKVKTIYDTIFFDVEELKDGTGLQDEKKIMESILKTFYSRMYFYNGKYYIERIKDIGTPNKQMDFYYPDTSLSTPVIIKNDVINLSNHQILNKTDTLSYNPGYQKVIVDLKYKKPSSLVDNIYFDLTFNTSYGTEPNPKVKNWETSFTKNASTFAYYENNVVTGDGCHFGANVTAPALNQTWWAKQKMSTNFFFNPNPTKTEVKISVDYYINPIYKATNYFFRGRYALRTFDASGNSWWIAKSNLTDTSTFFKNVEYTFDFAEIQTTTDVTTDINALNKYNGSATVDLTFALANPAYNTLLKRIDYIGVYNTETGVLHEYKYPIYSEQKINFFGDLYLDIYPIQRKYLTGGTYAPMYNTQFGNVDVDIDTPTVANLIEGELSNFNDTVTIALDLFDTSTCLYTNGVYNVNVAENISSIRQWRDSSLRTYQSLQFQFLEDIAQVYARPRYQLNIDAISNDSSIWTLGNLYTHDTMVKDGSILNFQCNGLEYNVKQNAYRLSLSEYITDSGWRIDPCTYTGVDPPPEPPVDFLTIDQNVSYWDGYLDPAEPCPEAGTTNRINVQSDSTWTIDKVEGTPGEGTTWFNTLDYYTDAPISGGTGDADVKVTVSYPAPKTPTRYGYIKFKIGTTVYATHTVYQMAVDTSCNIF